MEISFTDPYDEIEIADLIDINDRILQKMFLDIDYKDLAVVLTSCQPAIAARVEANVSEDLWALIKTEMTYMPRPPAARLELARKEIIHAIGRWTKGLD